MIDDGDPEAGLNQQSPKNDKSNQENTSHEKPQICLDDTRLVQVQTQMNNGQKAELALELKQDSINEATNDMLLNFCSRLRRVRESGWFKDAPDDSDVLILSAMNKSYRQDSLESMSQEQSAEIEEFILFLKTCAERTREDSKSLTYSRDFRKMPSGQIQFLMGRFIDLYGELRGLDELPSTETSSQNTEFDCGQPIKLDAEVNKSRQLHATVWQK